MKNEKNTFRLAEIIVRSFRTELTPEEQAVLDAWLSEDKHHEVLYKRYAGEEFLKQKQAEVREMDWQKDYLHFIKKYPLPRRTLHFSRWTKYAALFILPLALGIFLWLQYAVQPAVLTAEVVPVEKAKPVLTLAGGQKIVLTDSVRMQETDGTLVAGETGVLSYQREHVTGDSVRQTLYNRLEIPRGAEYFLTLADGTKIWLNSESEIRYPVNFSGSKREVYLIGEAFFKVAEDQNHPFVVHAQETQIEVLGTEFNVRNYADESHVATTLVNGSVRLTDIKTTQKIILKPGEQGCIDKTTGIPDVRDVDTYLYTAWKDSRFVFRNTRMEDLLNTLVRWYDLEIFYQNNSVKDICFTGDMTRMGDFRRILSIIESNERVRFMIDDRTVIVSLK